MRYLSVCSGIEAASVAWHDMGWQPVAFSEIEPFPSAVLKHRFPHVPNWGDMTKFQSWPDATINLLVGGTPCQSFSVAGLRQGLKDPRGNLMLTFLAIAERYKPKWIVWENVPGVLSSNGGKDFGSFLGALGELGYGWAFRVLDAAWFGVAQRRRRVFVVGCLGDQRSAAKVLFESESVSRHPAPSREKGKAVAGAAADGVGSGSQWMSPNGDQTASTVTTRSGGQPETTPTLIKSGPHGVAIPISWDSECNANVNLMGTIVRGGQGGRTDGVAQPISIQGNLVGRDSGGPQGMGASVDGTMYTLTKSDVHAVAHAFKIRGGSPTETGEYGGTPGKAAGKGYLGSDELAFTIAASQDQQIAYRKVRRAQSADDFETWKRDEVMNCFDKGDVRAVNVVLEPIAVDMYNQTVNEHTSQTLGSSASDVNHYGAVLEQKSVGALCARDFKGVGSQYVDEGKVITSPVTMAIRRLTPLECERLQGFPDNWTLIPWKNKPIEDCPDGPRYKACGNSMAVPCMRWIGQRINDAKTELL